MECVFLPDFMGSNSEIQSTSFPQEICQQRTHPGLVAVSHPASLLPGGTGAERALSAAGASPACTLGLTVVTCVRFMRKTTIDAFCLFVGSCKADTFGKCGEYVE